jgi:hypothetical protein
VHYAVPHVLCCAIRGVGYAVPQVLHCDIRGVHFAVPQVLALLDDIKHDFLLKEPLAECLRAHIFCTMRAAETHWDIISLP